MLKDEGTIPTEHPLDIQSTQHIKHLNIGGLDHCDNIQHTV